MTSLAVKYDDREERNNKALAAVITIIIHAGLLLFLLYYIIVTPIPPYPEPPGGPELELDFGNGINGTGNVEANNIGNNTSHETKLNKAATARSKANNPVITNDVENTTTLNNSKKIVHAPAKKDTAKPQPQVSIELAGLENKFKNSKGSAGGNGNSGQQGNAGSPNGVNPGTGMGTGNGLGIDAGKGFKYNLNGRKLVTGPKLRYNNPEQGLIIVGITVDQDGNVTEAIPGMKGSIITDENLYIMVKNAAMKIKFDKSPDGTPEQSGTVTFVFTIK